MSYIVGEKTLRKLWEAYHKERGRSFAAQAERLMIEIVRCGWAQKADIEDVLFGSDPRLSGLDVEGLAKAFDLHWEIVFERPASGRHEVWGSRHLSAIHAAELFITMEHLGFQVEPSKMVNLLRPAVLLKTKVTAPDLSVLWYEKQRGRMAITLKAVEETAGAKRWPSVITPEGHEARAYFKDDGTPLWMLVAGPRHKQERSRLPETF